MLKDLLYWIIYRLADIHEWILQWNNSFELRFSDKQLHFLVIGVVGMTLFLVIHPIIRWLAKRGWEMVISWFYTMTLIVVLTFGIEIGQKVTATGSMEFADIVFGIGGFLMMFAAFLALCGIWKLIRKLIEWLSGR